MDQKTTVIYINCQGLGLQLASSQCRIQNSSHFVQLSAAGQEESDSTAYLVDDGGQILCTIMGNRAQYESLLYQDRRLNNTRHGFDVRREGDDHCVVQRQPQKKSKTGLYVAIGAGCLAVIAAIVGVIWYYSDQPVPVRDFYDADETEVEERTSHAEEQTRQAEAVEVEEAPAYVDEPKSVYADFTQLVCYTWLTDDDLRWRGKAELRQMRNHIYARHGYIFKDPELAERFATFDWYVPRVTEVSPSELTDIERHNVEMIQKNERE